MIGYEGRCRWCLRIRLVYSVRRMGGGAYNRARRQYSSSICRECAVALLASNPQYETNGFDVGDLEDVAGAAE